MNLTQPCLNILTQLSDLTSELRENDFSKPSGTLNGSTLGQHLRHTLEFFICMEDGYNKGIINYDKRAHDKLIETDKVIALEVIDRIKAFVKNLEDNKPLSLEVGYDLERDEFLTVETNVIRELVYNIEHAVHHMAIMKIGIKDIAPYVKLPHDFGVAASTVRYKNQSAHASR
jgi:hypothetical protein